MHKVNKEITMAAKLPLYNSCILDKLEDLTNIFLIKTLAFYQLSKILRAKALDILI